MLSLHGTTNNPPDNKELFVEYKVSLADWYKEYLKDANRCSAEQTQKPTFTLNGVYKGGIPIKALTIPINTCDLSKTNNVGFEGIFVPIYGVMYLMIPLVALAGIFY
ncbi:hypothetical protein AGMMS49941_13020 [Deferribacterales bacterium]|nr:hypothetical protein AGMMS49941_13020 [Deferribacterales bacterium]